MKQVVIFLILILAPLAVSSQNNGTIATNGSAIIKVETTTIASNSNKRNHTYFAAQKEAVELNYKKSLDLISIKSFRKTTHLRSKDRRRC